MRVIKLNIRFHCIHVSLIRFFHCIKELIQSGRPFSKDHFFRDLTTAIKFFHFFWEFGTFGLQQLSRVSHVEICSIMTIVIQLCVNQLFCVASIATRFSVYVINYERVDEATKVLTPKEDEQMSIDCMCKVSDTRVGEGKIVLILFVVVSFASLCCFLSGCQRSFLN